MSRMDRLRQMLAKSPEDADLHYMLAQEHAKADGHAAAIEHYGACLESSPDYLYAYWLWRHYGLDRHPQVTRFHGPVVNPRLAGP